MDPLYDMGRLSPDHRTSSRLGPTQGWHLSDATECRPSPRESLPRGDGSTVRHGSSGTPLGLQNVCVVDGAGFIVAASAVEEEQHLVAYGLVVFQTRRQPSRSHQGTFHENTANTNTK